MLCAYKRIYFLSRLWPLLFSKPYIQQCNIYNIKRYIHPEIPLSVGNFLATTCTIPWFNLCTLKNILPLSQNSFLGLSYVCNSTLWEKLMITGWINGFSVHFSFKYTYYWPEWKLAQNIINCILHAQDCHILSYRWQKEIRHPIKHTDRGINHKIWSLMPFSVYNGCLFQKGNHGKIKIQNFAKRNFLKMFLRINF